MISLLSAVAAAAVDQYLPFWCQTLLSVHQGNLAPLLIFSFTRTSETSESILPDEIVILVNPMHLVKLANPVIFVSIMIIAMQMETVMILQN